MFIVVKAAGKQSQDPLKNTSAATVSSYEQADKNQYLVKCLKCGRPRHGDRGDTQANKEKAWNTIC